MDTTESNQTTIGSNGNGYSSFLPSGHVAEVVDSSGAEHHSLFSFSLIIGNVSVPKIFFVPMVVNLAASCRSIFRFLNLVLQILKLVHSCHSKQLLLIALVE